MKYHVRSLADRFWEKVDKTSECWLWTGSRYRSGGYGQFAVEYDEGRQRHGRAHRVAWILTHGAIPAGMEVLHSCDNPICVNPDHLFLGTQQDNMDDMIAKGRNYQDFVKRGPDNVNSKISTEEIETMKLLRNEGIPVKEIATRFGIHPQYLYQILEGKSRANG
jgi:hypothetical protein